MKKREILGKSGESKVPSTTTVRKPTGVRAFLQANRNRVITKRSSPVFHDAPPTNDLSANMIQTARKSGMLNLSSRGLSSVPSKVWSINDLDEREKNSVSVSLDNPSEEQKWWEFEDLQKLILANNGITEIPSDVGRLISLQTLDAHDNEIHKIANEISALENLIKFNLSHNKITNLPQGLYKLKRLNELNLSHNRIEEISRDIGDLSCLLLLDISNNNLAKLPDDIGYLRLTTLNLSNNNLRELPSDIGGLTGLHTLDVSDNCLTTMPASLSELVHLEVLYLRKNKLKLCPNVSKCGNLKEIYLQNNLITVFNSEVFAMTKIQLLDFRANKIMDLVIEKDHLEFADRFYLDNNDICVLPDDLALLPSLKSLTLDGNPLRGIRLDIMQRGTVELLKYLRTKVNISERENHRKSFNIGYGISPQSSKSSVSSSSAEASPRGCAGVTELNLDPYKLKATRLLNVSSRNVKALDDKVFEIASNSQVNVIDLSKNQLTQLPSSIEKIGEFLTELKLDSNKLTSLPSCIGTACTRLYYLSVQCNAISDFPPEFANLKNLREINIAYNRLQEIPACVYEMQKLEIFIAADNKIVTLDTDKLRELKRLAVLDMRNNNIIQLPPELGLMTQLKSLLVEGNAFRVPGYQILSQGTDTLLNYLRNRIVVK